MGEFPLRNTAQRVHREIGSHQKLRVVAAFLSPVRVEGVDLVGVGQGGRLFMPGVHAVDLLDESMIDPRPELIDVGLYVIGPEAARLLIARHPPHRIAAEVPPYQSSRAVEMTVIALRR